MSTTAETRITLQGELKQLLIKYGVDEDQAQAILAKIGPDLEEALNMAEFVQSSGTATTDTSIEDPLAHLSDKDRAAHIQQRLAGMDPETRKGLAHSRGKWTRDNG